MVNKRINVTKPLIPPLDEFQGYLDKIWNSGILTNKGPFHEELERKLENYLKVKHISLFSSGTTALLVSLFALKVRGEVITTPYSFIATANSILWAGAKPVFVDIDPVTLNIDPSKIQEAITTNTTAILPVHCYGVSCDVSKIKKIAKENNLKVIYDAAPSFGVTDAGGSILRHGDLSVLSFHATKVFSTIEGGAIISPNLEMKKKVDKLRNFGFEDEITISEPGINGKMSELHAAFGLLQLKYIDESISQRKKLSQLYKSKLNEIEGIILLDQTKSIYGNGSYFPVLVNEKFRVNRDKLYEELKKENIYARRYFFPLITQTIMYKSMSSSSKKNLPIANKISHQILCLPLSSDLDENSINRIVRVIINLAN
jgi:dTDP-4-amino-4,6-dideoxygalactose transaminase